MGEARRGVRPAVLWPAIGAIAVAGLLLWRCGREPPAPPPAPEAARSERPRTAARPAGDAPRQRPGVAERPEEPGTPEPDPSEGMFDASALAWSKVDLDAVRAALPDNSYWERSAPTDDPEVLRERAEERAYWERRHGKVLSNTASEEEVRAYYAHRQRLSADAVELATHLLHHYGGELPERDVGLLQLALRLHRARLEELPRELTDALARRESHEQVRREWLEQQQLFEDAEDPDAPPSD